MYNKYEVQRYYGTLFSVINGIIKYAHKWKELGNYILSEVTRPRKTNVSHSLVSNVLNSKSSVLNV